MAVLDRFAPSPSRRSMLAGGGAAALSLWASPAAKGAAGVNLRNSTYRDERIGYISSELDLDYGVALTWSTTRSAPLVVAYTEGNGARLTIANGASANRELVAGPWSTNYDRPAAKLVFRNWRVITVTSAGLLLDVNPDSMSVKAFNPAAMTLTERTTGPRGQMSTISESPSSAASLTGTIRGFVGDFDGNFTMFTVSSASSESLSPWYNFGKPFRVTYGADVDVVSTAVAEGYVYWGVRGGSHTGLYRIPVATLETKAAAGGTLAASDFKRINLSSQGSLDNSSAMLQLVVLPASPSRLLARIGPSQWACLRLATAGDAAPSFDPLFSWSQPLLAHPDGASVIARLRLRDGTYDLLRLELVNTRTNQFLARVGVGQIDPGSPVVQAAGALYAVTFGQKQVLVSRLQSPVTEDANLLGSPVVLESPVLAPASQPVMLARVQITGGAGTAPERLLVGPYWVNDPHAYALDAPDSVQTPVDLLSPAHRVDQDISSPKATGSTQVESLLGYHGDFIVATYPHGGVQRLTPTPTNGGTWTKQFPDDPNSATAGATGDPTASRGVAQVELPDGNVAIGFTCAFDSLTGAGVSIFHPSAGSMVSYGPAQVKDKQNVTALEVLRASNRATLIAGTSTRLESSTNYAPATGACLVAFDYAGGTLSNRREIAMPPGMTSVWAVRATASGRVFVQGQYGDSFVARDGVGPRWHTILELDPVSLQPLKQGNGPSGLGIPIWASSSMFKYNGAIVDVSPTELVVRTGAVMSSALLSTGAPGVQSTATLRSSAGYWSVQDFAVSSNGSWYFVNWDGYVYRRRWGV